MFIIFLHGQKIAEFESQGLAHRYCHRSPFHLTVTHDGQPFQFTGKPQTEAALRLQEIMNKNQCTKPQARKLLNLERSGLTPEAQHPPGRPALDKTARVREVMAEKNCSYGTAYQQVRREKKARSEGRVLRPVGRPSLHAEAIRTIAKNLSCSQVEAEVELDEALMTIDKSLNAKTRERMALRQVLASLATEQS